MKIMSTRYTELEQTIRGWEETGVSLITSNGSQLLPASLSDDVGIYYFIPWLSRTFSLPLDTAINVFYLGIAVTALVLGGIGTCLLFRSWISRVVMMMALMFVVAGAYTISDVYLVPPCVRVGLIPLALGVLHRSRTMRSTVLLMIGCGLACGISGLIRSHSGTAVLLFLTAGLWMQTQFSVPRRALLTAALLLTSLVPRLGIAQVTSERDQYLAEHIPDYQAAPSRHPFWHTVYCGLGYVHNPYGLAWNDSVAAERVRSTSPRIEYLSPEYEQTLRDASIGIMRQDIYYVSELIFAKAGVITFHFLCFAGIGLVCMYHNRSLWRLIPLWLLALAFDSIYGLIGLPWRSYLTGFTATATIASFHAIAVFTERHRVTSPLAATYWAVAGLAYLKFGWSSPLKGTLIGGVFVVLWMAWRHSPAIRNLVNRTIQKLPEKSWQPTRMLQVTLLLVIVQAFSSARKLDDLIDLSWNSTTEIPISVDPPVVPEPRPMSLQEAIQLSRDTSDSAQL